MWKVGDKAHCTENFDGGEPPGGPWENPSGRPKEGHVYLVKRVIEWPGVSGLVLVGLPTSSNGKEAGWADICFRKLVSRTEREKLKEK